MTGWAGMKHLPQFRVINVYEHLNIQIVNRVFNFTFYNKPEFVDPVIFVIDHLSDIVVIAVVTVLITQLILYIFVLIRMLQINKNTTFFSIIFYFQ